MNKEESIQQIETLIEAWQLDEADLNQIDINAMQSLLKENQELKKKYENAVVDYETTMAEKNELKEQVEEYKDNYNCLLKQKEQFEYIMSKQVDYQGQKKEFIKYLEDEIERKRKNATCMFEYYDTVLPLKEILQKYKSIIGVSNEKK